MLFFNFGALLDLSWRHLASFLEGLGLHFGSFLLRPGPLLARLDFEQLGPPFWTLWASILEAVLGWWGLREAQRIWYDLVQSVSIW